jgi:formylglycine-generating enzyme required for sulfatase activity
MESSDRSRTPVGLALLGIASLSGVLAGSVPSSELRNSLGIKLIRVEPGTFLMGSDARAPKNPEGTKDGIDADWDEGPAHRVTISKAFYLAETEVTEAQYRQFDPSFRGNGKGAPFVSGVSWEDANAFCRWLSGKEGKPYRLLTESEWEYACRAGTTTRFSSGETLPEAEKPNPWGLRNMHTGVMEWVLDWHGMYPTSSQVDPVGPNWGYVRVLRGGGVGAETPYFSRSANRSGLPPDYRSEKAVGFRVVLSEMPRTRPLAYEPPFNRLAVKQNTAKYTIRSVNSSEPYFRKRWALPIPPEVSRKDQIISAGLHPAMGHHNHSPGLAVMPNGDVIAAYFSSSHGELDPNTSIVAARLRYGAEEWDMPDMLYDIPDAGDVSPMLWADRKTVYLFWGGRHLPGPFRWVTTSDSGANWSSIQIAQTRGNPGLYTPQPITSAFRSPDGAIYVATDGDRPDGPIYVATGSGGPVVATGGEGGDSLLWVSRDESKTWADTGGRTGGRHTAFVIRKDGCILGLGGKGTHIANYMLQSVSCDWGKTWTISKTQFPALGTNQRPVVLRLASGRLFFASDHQHISGRQPAGYTQRGSFVALSDDEGKTWKTRTVSAAQPHETRRLPDGASTFGYVAAAQSPDGTIHLLTTMTAPALHFEMNEAWILEDQSPVGRNAGPKWITETEKYPSGVPKSSWRAKITAEGRFLLDGPEVWRHPDGRKQYEVTWRDGHKVGIENLWAADGSKRWTRTHSAEGSVWVQWFPDGSEKIKTRWRNGRLVSDGVWETK